MNFHLARRTRLAAFALIAAAVIAGCSKLPTAPTLGANDAAPGAPSSMTYVADPAETPSGAPTSTDAQPISTSRDVNGLLGGVVRAGDFSVVVPPGAFFGTARITVTQPDGDALRTNLEISPASKNHFLLPVLLIADCRGKIDPRLISLSFISWFNPATQQWEQVPGCSVNVLNLTVQAPLWHFSSYRVDSKASW
jgi:hypothetical protein